MTYSGNTFRLCLASVATMFVLVGPAFGQTAAEHATHHPAPGASPAASSPAAPAGMPMSGGSNQTPAVPGATPMAPGGNQAAPAAPSGMGGGPPGAVPGGMGAEMGEMMKQMGTPPPKELYPSLMALPDEPTREQRAGIEQLAHERMQAGSALLSAGLAKLADSTSDEDYATMQQAAEQMREGLAEFEAGLAARRLLSEGKAVRNLALDWFKREMNLASPKASDEPRTLLGIPPFHLFTMVLLIGFALAMLAMYFFKMRRAAALFGRIGPDTNPPPPGASPPPARAAAPVPGGGVANG